jgi:alanine dehydrogenase
VGHAATHQAFNTGAHVIVLDEDVGKLRALHHDFGGRVVTVVAGAQRLEQYTAIADVVIGCVLIPGTRAPFVVTEDMVKTMKPGSVILDISIDQGGCVETSRPTSIDEPTYVAHDVVHYCVPNMTANVARTASRALTTGALQYIQELADLGLDETLGSDSAVASGVYLYRGKMVHAGVAQSFGMDVTPLNELLGKA